MPYRITDRQPLDAELRRIAREQLDGALAALGDASRGEASRTHAARKRCKKLRALLRLARPQLGERTYRRVDRHFRDAARRVSDARDAAVFITTYDLVCERFADEIDRRGTASIRAALTRRSRAHGERLDREGRLERFASDLERGRTLIDAIGFEREAPGDERFDALRPGFARVHDRARKQLCAVRADGTPEAYHEWRKHVKHHRCHLRLLHAAWPGPMTALEAEASRLGELLGDAHDLAALDAHLRAEPDGLGHPRHVASFSAFARTLRAELERGALPLGARLFAEKGKRVAKRVALWHAAR